MRTQYNLLDDINNVGLIKHLVLSQELDGTKNMIENHFVIIQEGLNQIMANSTLEGRSRHLREDPL